MVGALRGTGLLSFTLLGSLSHPLAPPRTNFSLPSRTGGLSRSLPLPLLAHSRGGPFLAASLYLSRNQRSFNVGSAEALGFSCSSVTKSLNTSVRS